MKDRCATAWALAWSLALAAPALAAPEVLKKTADGAASVQSIDVLSFGPDGVLFIGDGKGAQVVAVATDDTQPGAKFSAKIEGFGARLAERLGTKPDGIEIIDLAVNPASGRAYVAVRKQDDKSYAIITVDGAGKIGEWTLEKVRYARLSLSDGKTTITKVNDVAWAGDRLLVSATANDEFASKIFVVPGPLSDNEQGAGHSAETYHVQHRRWETRAPMTALIPYRQDGKTYVVGAFACTPVVRYAVDDLQPGAEVKGESVLEIGSGNKPLDMFTYEKDGRGYVLANTFRFHHQKRPYGPSPYWTVRFDRDLLGETTNVNEKALFRLASNSEPATPKAQMIDTFHGVTQMDLLDGGRALVLRLDASGRVDLEPVALP